MSQNKGGQGAIKRTGRKDYTTPEWIVEAVRQFYRAAFPMRDPAGIDLDPCSNPQAIVNAARNIMLEDVPAALQGYQEHVQYLGGDPWKWVAAYVKGDGLKMLWAGFRTYINPPFGYDKVTKIGIEHWIRKAEEEARLREAEVILCLPDTAETAPWKNLILLKAQGRCQLKTRVKFGGMKAGIPKQISLVYFGSNPELFKSYFKHLGRVENPSVVYADQADILL